MDRQPAQYDVIVYETPSGKEPYRKWIQTLKDLRARSLIRLGVTRMMGGYLGDVRFFGRDIIEKRFFIGPGYRVYFGIDGRKIILLGGGDKSTQSRDIPKMQTRWDDYQRRK